MCDYSLMHAQSRPAVKDEELVVHNFGNASCGFRSINDDGFGCHSTAVCVLPGTQLEVENISVEAWIWYDKSRPGGDQAIFEKGRDVADQTAVFAKRNDLGQYHDALEFPDGTFVPVSKLKCGGRARVLQMPAEPVVEQAEGTAEGTPASLPRVLDEAQVQIPREFANGIEKAFGPVT